MDGCPHLHCYAPETSCALGHREISQCSEWKGKAAKQAIADETPDDILLPWSGSALGLVDISFVTGRGKPITVGILGPENAGKTTLLASWYLLLGKGLVRDEYASFGGSYSIEGWECIAVALRWSPGQRPSFPPHTTSRNKRAPGLLHLSLRQQSGRLRDFLFTDAPGEWFYKWAVNSNSDEAEGARWVSTHADVFLIIADKDALSGPNLGSARNSFQLLATRLAAERRLRPVALVWTKADKEINIEVETAIRKAVIGPIPGAAEFAVSIFAKDNGTTGTGLVDLFRWILGTRRTGIELPSEVSLQNDPLFSLGR
jgi:hypothetical protein